MVCCRNWRTLERLFCIGSINGNISAVKSIKRAKPKGPGRPPNLDKAIIFSTTLPESILKLLDAIAEGQRRTKSEIIADAIRAYARRFTQFIEPR